MAVGLILTLSACSAEFNAPEEIPDTVETGNVSTQPSEELAIVPKTITVPATGSVTFTAVGGKSPYIFSISSGGGIITPTTGEFTASATPGLVVIRATDSINNVSDAQVTVTALPGGGGPSVPVVVFQSPVASTAAQSGLTISGRCETGIAVSITGAGLLSPNSTTCSAGVFSQAILFTPGDGDKTITVSQTNSAGTGTDSRIFVRDTAAPSGGAIAINGGAGFTQSNTVNLSLSATDATGMYVTDSSDCSSGGNWEAFAGSKPWTLAQSNTTTSVYVKFKDAVGNETGCLSDTIIHDNLAPALGFTNPAENSPGASGLSITGSCESALTVNVSGPGVNAPSGVICAGGTFTQGITFSNGDGPKSVTISQTDSAGNAASASRIFVRDSTPPSLGFTGPAPDTVAQTGLTITGSCEAGLSVSLGGTGLDSPASTACTGSFSQAIVFSAGDGPKEITISQTDAAGNSASVSRSFAADTAPPTANSVSIAAGATHTNNAVVTLALASTGAASMYITNNSDCSSGGNWESYATSKVWVLGQTNSTATTYVKFKDSVGNESACMSDTIEHDNSAPLLSFTAPAAGSTGTSGVTVSGTCENGLTVNLSGAGLDSPASTACSGTFSEAITFTAADGPKAITISQTDAAGNTSTVSRTFNRDGTAPSAGSISINAGAPYTASNGVTLTLSATDAHEMYLTETPGCAAGGAWEPFAASKAWTLSQSETSVTVYAKFRDSALNESGCVSDAITHDSVDPALTFTSPAANTVGSSGLTIDGACETGLTVSIAGTGVNAPLTTPCAGGGVVRLTVSNACVINSGGTITANGNAAAAGGTVYLRCGIFGGNAADGAITANGGTANASYAAGGGGRIALITPNGVSGFTGSFAYPADAITTVTFKAKVRAYGGPAFSTSYPEGGAGTVYLKHSGLSYGALIINNGLSSPNLQPNSGVTALVSLTGTVNGVPGTSTLPINPSAPAGHTDLYAGMTLRPDLAYTNGTASNWTDDNVITVSSNTTTALTTTANFSGVSNGATFRSIDILDQLELDGGAFLQSSGDLYVLNGSLSAPGTGAYTFAQNTFLDVASHNFAVNNLTFTSGNFTINQPVNALNLTISGGTVKAPSITTTQNVSISGGTLTVSNLNVGADLIMTGGTLNHSASTTTAMNKLEAVVAGSLSLSGTATVNVNNLGYPVGYSYGPGGVPSVDLIPSNYAGASHGGRGGWYVTTGNVQQAGAVYDDYRNPVYPGGGRHTNAGGGVARFTVTGSCTINTGASMTANAGGSGAAGGSIYLNCASIGGTAATNAITAHGGQGVTGQGAGGGGGRIALISSGNAGSFSGSFAFPFDSDSLAAFKQRVRSYGGGAFTTAYPEGGAGTIYLKHSGLTYGAMIADNGYSSPSPQLSTGKTELVSMAGDISAPPGASTLSVNVWTTPSLGPSYVDLYKGMMLRPNLVFNNGTPSYWIDDNVVTVASNNASTLTTTAPFAGVSNGNMFRSIDIFDHIDVAGGAQLYSNGDIYVVNGQLSTPGSPTYVFASGTSIDFADGAGANFSFQDLVFAGGAYVINQPIIARSLTVSGATVTANGGVMLSQDLTVSSGSLITTSVNTEGSVTVSGGTLSTQNLYVTGNMTVSGGTITHAATTASGIKQLTATILGSLTMTGGTFNANGLGFPAGYSYTAFGPPVTFLGAKNNAGGSHGGKGAWNSGQPSTTTGPTYGDYRDPHFPGAGASATNAGGGVIRITTTGTCTINSGASITANGNTGGAGGSVYLKCASIGGTAASNAITANGGTGGSAVGGGGGGRIALITTAGGAASLSGSFTYPYDAASLSTFKSTVHAYGGAYYNANYPEGGAGTVYLKHSALTHGSLIIDNGDSTPSLLAHSGTTVLVSLAGTVSSAPGATTLPVTVTSTPTPTIEYDNLFAGIRIRPDLSFNNGSLNNWADDNILTVNGSSDTTLFTTATISGVAQGASFRSIDILDNIDIANGAILQSHGDVYVVNGPFYSPGSNEIDLSSAIVDLFDAAQFNLGIRDVTIAGGNLNLSRPINARNLNLSAGTVTVPSVVLSQNLAVSGGTLNTTSSTVNGNVNVTGGTFTSPSLSTNGTLSLATGTLVTNNLTVGGDVTVTSGTLKHETTTATTAYALNGTIGGTLTLNGGSINVSALGYLPGYSYGPSGPSTALAPTASSGASHGGQGGWPATAGATYGDYRNPSFPGGGLNTYSGGGVVRLTVTNGCIINSGATINASAAAYYGAGGSIKLTCASFSGNAATNAITANGGNAWSGGQGGGGGGRIALISTGNIGSFSGSFVYPTDATTLTNFKTRVRAWGGRLSAARPEGGAGTIFLKHSDSPNGALIVDNGLAAQSALAAGATFMPSLAGTVASAPGANSLPVNVTSSPALDPNYVGVYAGLRIRPDLTFTNGTAANWADDNLLTVSTHNTTTLSTVEAIAGVASGATFRSIDVVDHIDISGGAVFQSNGDLFVTSGLLSAPGSTAINLSEATLDLIGNASTNLTYDDITFSGGTVTLNKPLNVRNLVVSGATVTAPSITVSQTLTLSSGAITATTTTNVTGNVNMTGGSLTTPALTTGGNLALATGTVTVENLNVTGNLTITSGTLTHSATTATEVKKLQGTVGGILTMNGGTISANGLGYLAGYSYGPAGPSAALIGSTSSGASHGGQGGWPTNAGATYGDFRNPQLPGAGYYGATYAGGGVIKLNVAGLCTINSGATITANSSLYYAAGGSVNLNCAGFSGTAGTNAVTANGGAAHASGSSAGGGGRIALISSGDASSFAGNFAYPTDATSLTNFKTRVRAWGGRYAGTRPDGGAGTIYLKHSGLTHGSLIIDNGLAYQAAPGTAGATFMTSLAGKVNGVPAGNSMPITVTSSPAMSPAYTDLYSGLRLRPDLSFNNGTAANPIDDNVLTVSSNSDIALTMTSAVGAVPDQANFRSIDVVDHFDIGGGSVYQSNGDLYVVGGPFYSHGATQINLTNALFDLLSGATFNLPIQDLSYTGGTFTVPGAMNHRTLTVAGATITAPSLTLSEDLSVTSGTLTLSGPLNVRGITSAGTVTTTAATVTNSASVTGGAFTAPTLSVGANFTLSSGTATINTLNVPGDVLISGGTLTHDYTTATTVYKLDATIGGSFTMTGGIINASTRGYPAGYSYGATGPSTTLGAATSGSGTWYYGGGSHGGMGGGWTAIRGKSAYGDYRNPMFPGGGGGYSAGGGVVRLNVTGDCTVNSGASITANGNTSGAGGSVYMNCRSIGGTAAANAILALGGTAASWYAGGIHNAYGGSGGRVALITTGPPPGLLRSSLVSAG